MFDWLEFDKNVKKEYEEQTERLNAYITEFLRKNSQIRELPIFDEPSQETLDRILSMEIPAKGRNSVDVGNELVKDVFEQSMLIQHPRFFSFVASAVSPYSLAGSILTDIYNVFGGAWELSPGQAQ